MCLLNKILCFIYWVKKKKNNTVDLEKQEHNTSNVNEENVWCWHSTTEQANPMKHRTVSSHIIPIIGPPPKVNDTVIKKKRPHVQMQKINSNQGWSNICSGLLQLKKKLGRSLRGKDTWGNVWNHKEGWSQNKIECSNPVTWRALESLLNTTR